MVRQLVLSGKVAIRALGRNGFHQVRQSGSHIVLQKSLPGTTITVVVPNHRELAAGTLRSIIRKAGLSLDEFIALVDA